jgi:hypothetical protein
MEHVKKISISEYLSSKPVWKNIINNIMTEEFNYSIKEYITHNDILIKYWDDLCIYMNYKTLKYPQWRIILSPKMKKMSDKYLILDKRIVAKENIKNIKNDISVYYDNIDISSDIYKFKTLKNVHYTLTDEQILRIFKNEFTQDFLDNYRKYLKID